MENKVSEQNLKPCPFCGSTKLKLDKQTRNGRVTYSVRCNCCHARGGTSGYVKTTASSIRYNPYTNSDPTEELAYCHTAINKWNQRMGEKHDM